MYAYLWIPMCMRAHLVHVAIEISDHSPSFLHTSYVTRVTRYTIKHTSVKKFAPCVLLLNPVQFKYCTCNMVPQGEVFPESSNSQRERQATLSMETSMPKLFIFGNI
jgi:hypothetical protein